MIDEQKEIQALRKIDQDWADAKSVEEVEKFASEDIVIMAPGMYPMSGKEQMLAFYREYFESVSDSEGGPDKVEVSSSGDLGYTLGSMRTVSRGPDGAVEEDIKYVAVYRKQDGEWKGIVVMFNSNLAAE